MTRSFGLVIALFLLSAVGALAAYYSWGGRSPAAQEPVSPEAEVPSTAGDGLASGDSNPSERESVPELKPPPFTPSAPPPRGAQQGRIMGTVDVAEGDELPDTWRVVVGPSFIYQGDHPGVRRVGELTGDERDFDIEGLPLAGYSVNAEAAGYNSLPVDVLLATGKETQRVNLRLSRAGFLDGIVLDVEGRPVEGLLVTLENEANRARGGVNTQADGTFLFPDVLDGNYKIYYGDPEAPLLKPRALAFKAPAMRVPDAEVPVTGSLEILTLDDAGQPLPEVTLTGFGSKGGRILAMSDDSGRCTVHVLPPGSYRIFAKTEDDRKSRSRVDVKGGETNRVELRLSLK